MNVKALLGQRLSEYVSTYQQTHQQNPTAYIDPDHESPAQLQGTEQGELVQWQSVERDDNASLKDLANALETPINAQLEALFCSYYSGNLVAQFDGHEIELLLPWNQADFERLQQNIIGHVLMKRRLKQADTVFIGLTEQDDLLITVRLEDGVVCLEYVGKKPHHELAPSIETFLAQLSIQ